MTREIRIGAAAAAALLAIVVFYMLRDDGKHGDGSGEVSDGVASSVAGAKNPHRSLPSIPGVGGDTAAESVSTAACKQQPCKGPVCDTCTTENCTEVGRGCEGLTDATDRRLCEEVYACFTNPANDCTIQGDPVRCWCGTNLLTCHTDNEPPTQANGPCARLVLAAAKTPDAATIRFRFLDPKFPLGLAANLTACRGAFCKNECVVK